MALIENTVPIKPLNLMVAMKDGKFDDFIGVWEKFVPDHFCDEIIGIFNEIVEEWDALGVEQLNVDPDIAVWDGTAQFGAKNMGRCDKQILFNYANGKKTGEVQQYLTACVSDYCRVYGQLQSLKLMNSDMKLQMTPPGGGYHVWHYESGDFTCKHRELVWMIYLNDLPEGEGETEFLYQRRKIRPQKGTVVIWPAGMTHVHKGNTVMTTDKYILTGWYVQVA